MTYRQHIVFSTLSTWLRKEPNTMTSESTKRQHNVRGKNCISKWGKKFKFTNRIKFVSTQKTNKRAAGTLRQYHMEEKHRSVFESFYWQSKFVRGSVSILRKEESGWNKIQNSVTKTGRSEDLEGLLVRSKKEVGRIVTQVGLIKAR